MKHHKNLYSILIKYGTKIYHNLARKCAGQAASSYKNTGQFKETAIEFNLDDVMVLNVFQVFTEFIEAPKKEWLHYTPPPQIIEAPQVEAEVPKVVPIERMPYNEPLPSPMTATRHIRDQLIAEQKEEDVREVRAA
jgi:hypothetical protein